MRLIDVDILYVDWYDSFVADDGTEYDNIPFISKGQIDDAPSIDIVKCKECMHWYKAIDENGIERFNFSKCIKGHYGNGLEFYCADGERKES